MEKREERYRLRIRWGGEKEEGSPYPFNYTRCGRGGRGDFELVFGGGRRG